MSYVNCHQKQVIRHIAARLKKPAYGMNDAPRRWWNILDKALRSYGMVPTRADRCCYVLYSIQSRERTWKQNNITKEFVGHKISKTGGTLKSVSQEKAADEMEDPSGTKHEGRPPLHSFRCTQCTDVYWDRLIGSRVGRSSNVAT